jgi:hypothetical protein
VPFVETATATATATGGFIVDSVVVAESTLRAGLAVLTVLAALTLVLRKTTASKVGTRVVVTVAVAVAVAVEIDGAAW